MHSQRVSFAPASEKDMTASSVERKTTKVFALDIFSAPQSTSACLLGIKQVHAGFMLHPERCDVMDI